MRRHERRPSSRRVGIAATSLLALALSAVAITPSSAASDPLEPVAEEMRRILSRPVAADEVEDGRKALRRPDAPTEEVEDYLRQAEAAGVLLAALEPIIGADSFGGVRLDLEARLIEVSVPDSAAAGLGRRLTTVLPAVEVRRVPNSMQSLRATHAHVVESLPRLEAASVVVATVGEAVESNRVRVEVESPVGDAEAALRDIMPGHLPRVEVAAGQRPSPAVCLARDACPANVTVTGTTIPGSAIDEVLRGGIQLTGGGFRCTSGFAARRNSDNRVTLLTAGHCFDVGVRVSHGAVGRIGTVSTAVFGGSAVRDGGMVLLEDNQTYRWVQNNLVFTDFNMAQQVTQVYPRTGGSQAVNAPMAKDGDTTGTTSGLVLRTGITVMTVDGDTLTNATETTVCAEPGDSGGAVRWENVAHGIVSLSALTPQGRCVSNPRMYFNTAGDIEVAVGATIYES